jgi:hypothetical protein
VLNKIIDCKTSGIAALAESRETDYQIYEEVQTDCNNTLVAVQWLK